MAKDHRCPQCLLEFPFASKLQRHLETHLITGGDWLCGLCDTLFNRSSSLTNHWRNSCAKVKMAFCDDELKEMLVYDLREAVFRMTLDHYSASEKSPEEPGTSSSYKTASDDKTSICIYCNLLMPRGTLHHHYSVHTGRCCPAEITQNSVVPYVCDLCGFGFRYKKSLYNHWRHKCTEVLAHFPDGGNIENQELNVMVEDLVKRAEVINPIELPSKRDGEDIEKEDSGDIDDDEETSPYFTAPITALSFDLQDWNVENVSSTEECPKCNRYFHSLGRLDQHTHAFHGTARPGFVCKLCRMKFAENRILLAHLRSGCKPMRVEVPDEKKRKKMSAEELMKVVENEKSTWIELFENKKAANLKFIKEFLDQIDRRKPHGYASSQIVLNRPVPAHSIEIDTKMNSCRLCKITFKSSRFLYQHEQTVHQREPPVHRNQLTITATSLLPYFKFQEAKFYDSSGQEYRMGKYLEKNNGINVSRNVKKQKNNIVTLHGNLKQHVLLTDMEYSMLRNPDGSLKTFFSENPKKFGDPPVLEREE
ncbi:C2H2-type domain-containing protein [Caenorhabditis elegans]|uniref:C2H2-type domain-containing protein n=1 Tax=Caenorhabditis elegans TaxID=6239 RepID=Q9GZC9_CAEEL|nr:C2H2-type domain-containing protein [Caenorhabditis elegans]CCD63019.1 C2H2-type domain-containing protein [Caenorhabditis elegans]|eukprot:NP_504371.1 Uncharacterized protein CELE_C04F5.9 [Caenorhabditis elegans]